MIELAYRDDKIVKGVELVLESCDQFRELGMQGQKFVEDSLVLVGNPVVYRILERI
jgi:hypothetical protein